MKDSSKTNQELIAELSVLKKRMQELENSEAERKRVEEALIERNKELNCLYGISALFELPGISLDEILKRTVMLIPAAWQFPEITEASIILEGMIFQTTRFRETPWMQTREVAMNGMPVGRVEVCYLEKRQASDEGPFLKEERKLLNAIAERLGRITDRKRAEEELESERTLLRNLIDNVPDRIYAKDSEGRFIICNDAMIRRMGKTSMNELAGKSDFDFLPPEMAQQFRADEQAIIQSGIPMINREEPLSTEGGTITRWNLATKVPLLDRQGNRIGIVGVGREITDRKRAEEELRDSEERYRRIIEAASDAVLLRRKDIVIYANPAALKLFRANHPEDLIGKRYLDLVHPDDRTLSIERVKKSQNESWIAPLREHRILALDGQAVHVESTGIPVQYRRETHVFGIFRDITGRKRTEMEISTLADIGRIISSTPDIDEVYERFAETVRKIIPFDRIVINNIDVEMNSVTDVYMAGHGIADRKVGVSYPLKGSGNFEIVHTNSSLLIQTENFDEYQDRFPLLLSTFQAGFRSIMNIPIVSKGKVIGGLLLRSFKPYAYTDHDMNLAERVGNQIAGAIVNAQLYAGLKKTQQDLQESEQRYRELSIVDDLTRLYNSRQFYVQLKIELDRSNRYELPLTLMLLDLDNFKAFNDAYGHIEGDHVLRQLGKVIKRCLRETDFAYRYGGEEFTILLPMTTGKDAAVTAERIRTEFKKETFSPMPDHDVHLTVSIGLAQYKPQEEMKTFVHRVDQLMYQGKKCGRDRVCSES